MLSCVAQQHDFPTLSGNHGIRNNTTAVVFLNNLGWFARDRFAERPQKGQRVLVVSSMNTPDYRNVGDVLTEKGGEMWAIIVQLGG